MFKRKADSSDNSDQPPAKQAAQELIPRHLPLQHIELNFVQRTWQEFAPGELYYVPTCQTIKYMFDEAMHKQLAKFKGLWHTMEIISPKVEFKNLIMLQDDLRVQSNTPTDATAFTQVVYLLKFCPRGQSEYFKLVKVDKDDMKKVTNLSYNLDLSNKVNDKQLVKIQGGFDLFDTLGVIPAKANSTAGFVPYAPVSVDPTTFKIREAYIAPNTSTTELRQVACNLDPEDNKTNYLNPTNVITLARNQDHIEFYKYGDSFSIPIKTNLDNVKLINIKQNDFTEDLPITVEKNTYQTEWIYPGYNRPPISRADYFDVNTNPITRGKSGSGLEHSFICMPPILKPNGAPLGQRCSCTMEQSVTIRFDMTQAVFQDESTDAQQMAQKDAVILRRAIYPTPGGAPPPPPKLNSWFCRHGLDPKFENEYEDTVLGIIKYFKEQDMTNIQNFTDFTSNPPDDPMQLYKCKEGQKGFIFDDLSFLDRNLITRWFYCMQNGLPLYVKCDPVLYQPDIQDPKEYYAYWLRNDADPLDYPNNVILRQGDDVASPDYFIIYMNRFTQFVQDNASMKCLSKYYANANNNVATAFFR